MSLRFSTELILVSCIFTLTQNIKRKYSHLNKRMFTP
ncbi:hypothetical protein X975_04442, partial [Stegodyphus mimosarum]